MKKLSLILLIFLAAATFVNAQQDAQYSMYMFNGLYINPAFAGSKDALAVDAIYRHQWAGFDGAPRSFSVGAHTPFKKDQYAIGVLFTHDRLGVRKFNHVFGSFAFRPQLNDNNLRLSLGIQTGFAHFNPDFLSLENATNDGAGADAALGLVSSSFLPNVGAGVMLINDRFYLGFSVPHFINNGLSDGNPVPGGNQSQAEQRRHYLGHAGVVIGKEEAKVKFKPSILMKFVPQTPIDFDFNASFLFVDRFWLGAGYRTGGDRAGNNLGRGESIIGIFEMKITQQLALGYAYDYTLSELQAVNSGSHEIFLGFEFSFQQKKFVNPRYIKYF